MEHSILPPSSAHIWGAPDGCPGWATIRAAFPGESGREALEGTAAHEVATCMLTGATVPRIASNGIPIDEEILDGAATFAADVLAHEAWAPPWRAYPDRRVKCSRIHPEHAWGTCDLYSVHVESSRVVVWEYKHGHRVVRARENWQAISYAGGAVEAHDLDPLAVSVEVRVVQPRAYRREGPVDVWHAEPAKFVEMIHALHVGAARSLSGIASCHSGDHCRDCTGRAMCSAALQAGASLYEATCEALPLDVTPSQLAARYGLISRAVDHLEALQKAHEAQLTALIQKGTPVPSYALEPGGGRETWDVDDEAVIFAAAAVGKAIGKPKALTPNQARAAGVPKAIVNSLSSRKPGALKLVEIDHNQAMEVFKS